MNALVLVGGEGTRLRPLTYDTPKPMLPIVERPIIARIVEWLSRYGIAHATLSLGYRPDAFIDGFPDSVWEGVSLSYAVEPSPLDTAGAIKFAAEFAGLGNEPFLVINGDILTDLNLEEFIAFHRSHGGEATIALTPVTDPSAFGVVPTDADGRVTAFVEKPAPGTAPTNFINAGTYVLEPSVLDRIASDRRVSIEREVFPAIVDSGALFAMASDAYWIDTGSPDRYIQAQVDVLSGTRPNVIIPPHTTTASGVRLATNVNCSGDCSGAVFIGAGSTIADGAQIIDSVVGAGSAVHAGATVRNCILLPGAVIGEGAVCADSIIGKNAHVGERATLRGFTVIGTDAVVDAGDDLDSARVPV